MSLVRVGIDKILGHGYMNLEMSPEQLVVYTNRAGMVKQVQDRIPLCTCKQPDVRIKYPRNICFSGVCMYACHCCDVYSIFCETCWKDLTQKITQQKCEERWWLD